MKIIYLVHQFYPEYYTGTEKFVYKISSMMQKAGHNVKVITYSFQRNSFFNRSMGDTLYREFTYKGIPVTAIRHRKIPENINITLGDEGISPMAERMMSREKPDIVHAGHSMRVNEFISASHRLDIPYIITLTDFWLICPKVNFINSRSDLCAGPEGGEVCAKSCPELPRDLLLKRCAFAKDILFDAKRVISPSRFLSGLFKKELGSLDVTVVKHGISYNRIKRNNRTYKKGDKLVFCYAGSLNDHKGIHVLIDAFKMTKSSNIILKIFGSGPNPLYVNRLFDMARKDKRIEFCGVYSEDDIGDIFSSVDVMIVPSLWYENYPLVLHEALACNTPVVASNQGGMAERIKDGVNGFTFEIGDAESLRAVFERIITNPEILNHLKANIESSLIPTIEQEAVTYLRIYTDIKQSRNSDLLSVGRGEDDLSKARQE